MLLLGNMCHCKNTLWKIDPASGEIIWAADRGRNTLALSYYYDRLNVYLYEHGGYSPSDTASTKWQPVKWRDDYDKATPLWRASPSPSGGVAAAEYASDNKLWLTDTYRLNDSDGTTASSRATSLFTPSGSSVKMDQAPAGGMFFVDQNGFGGLDVKLVSSGMVNVATAPLNVRMAVRKPTGWFVYREEVPPPLPGKQRIETYDDSLALVASVVAPLTNPGFFINIFGTLPYSRQILVSGQRDTNGKVFARATWVGPLPAARPDWWHLYDSNALTEIWNSPMLSQDFIPGAIDADGDVYVGATDLGGSDAAGTTIYRLSGIRAATVWSRHFQGAGGGTFGGSYEMIRWNDLLLVISTGGTCMSFDGLTGIAAMALRASDGSIVWARSIEGAGGFSKRPRIVNDALYCAGARAKRARVPNLVHL